VGKPHPTLTELKGDRGALLTKVSFFTAQTLPGITRVGFYRQRALRGLVSEDLNNWVLNAPRYWGRKLGCVRSAKVGDCKRHGYNGARIECRSEDKSRMGLWGYATQG